MVNVKSTELGRDAIIMIGISGLNMSSGFLDYTMYN